MGIMKSKTLLTVAACLMAMVFTAPAQADHHLGICVEWNPDFGTFDCNLATPALEIGSISSGTDPSFSVATNGVSTYENVVVMVLVPDTTVTLQASFNGGGNVSPNGSYTIISNDYLFASMPNDLSILSRLYDEPVDSGADWHFNSIAALSVVPVTFYTVIVFETGLPVKSKNAPGGPLTVMVDIAGTVPVGSIIMAYALNTSSPTWSVDTSVPLTNAIQVVPEPGTLTLLGTGLFALGLLRLRTT